MNKDFRVAVGFVDHPKTLKLYARFGGDGVFALLRLWDYAAKWRTDGVFHGDDRETLLIACGLRGSVEGFIENLVLLRFLDVLDPDGRRLEFGVVGEVAWVLDALQGRVLAVHDWEDHNPYAAKARERSEQGRRNAERRYAKRTGGGNADGTANGTANGSANGNAARTAARGAGGSAPLPFPLPAPSPSSASSAPGHRPEHEQGDTAVFIMIPTNRRGEEFPVTEGAVKRWEEAYPAVDVRQELRNVREWGLANVRKRKTMSGVERHVVSWLQDRQNNPKARKRQGADKPMQGFSDDDLA